MNEKSLCQDGDTDQCAILLQVGTKNREKGLEKGDEMICNNCGCIFNVVTDYICPECESMDTSAI